MSDTDKGPETKSTRPGWVNDAEEALERATDAVRTAWNESRDARMSALDSAKEAAKQLGEAIDRGVETARGRWQKAEGEGEESPSEAGTTPEQQRDAGEEE